MWQTVLWADPLLQEQMWASGIILGTAHRFLLEISFMRTDFRFFFFFPTHGSSTVVPVGKARKGRVEYLTKFVNLGSERLVRIPCSGTGLLRDCCTFAALINFVNLFQKSWYWVDAGWVKRNLFSVQECSAKTTGRALSRKGFVLVLGANQCISFSWKCAFNGKCLQIPVLYRILYLFFSDDC